MKITSAKFIKGVVGEDRVLSDGIPQVAFIGRSNVGKSSVINSLTSHKKLCRSSSFPGCTQQINVFLINRSFYLIDLPGYGFAKASRELKDRLEQLISWYLFDSGYEQQKIVLIIDAKVGPTQDDLDMLYSLKELNKEIIIVANKIDKISGSERKHRLQKLEAMMGSHKLIPYSAKKDIGVGKLIGEVFGK